MEMGPERYLSRTPAYFPGLQRSIHLPSVISAAEALSKKLWNPVPEPKQPRYAYSPIVAGSRPGTTGSVEGLGGAVAVGPTTVDRTTDETWEDCTVAVDTMTVPFCVKLVTMVAGFGTVV